MSFHRLRHHTHQQNVFEQTCVRSRHATKNEVRDSERREKDSDTLNSIRKIHRNHPNY